MCEPQLMVGRPSQTDCVDLHITLSPTSTAPRLLLLVALAARLTGDTSELADHSRCKLTAQRLQFSCVLSKKCCALRGKIRAASTQGAPRVDQPDSQAMLRLAGVLAEDRVALGALAGGVLAAAAPLDAARLTGGVTAGIVSVTSPAFSAAFDSSDLPGVRPFAFGGDASPFAVFCTQR